MKYQKILGLVATAGLLLAGCATDSDNNNTWLSDPNAVHVSASVGSIFTRSNPAAADEKDQKGFNSGDVMGVSNNGTSLNYTFDGTNWQPGNASDYLVWDDNNLKFQCWYPADGKNTFSKGYIQEDQGNATEIAKSDYMTAEVTDLKEIPGDRQLKVAMERKTARLILNIQSFNDQFTADTKVDHVRIVGKECTDASETSTINIKPLQNGKGGTGTTYTALVAPGKVEGKLYFTTDESTETPLVVKTGALEAGKSYTYNLIVGKNKVTIGNVTVAEWGTDKIDGGKAEFTPYVTFTADAAQTFKMITSGNYAIDKLEYSLDGNEWTAVEKDKEVEFGGEKGSLFLRGTNINGTASTWSEYSTITFTDPNVKVACTGDIRTLLNWKNYRTVETKNARFCYLFKYCAALTSAPELPATTLSNFCYDCMFYGCTSLTAAPELKATTLAYSCYHGMFYGCTSLTSAPELKATTLENNCYSNMFSGCTSLTSAPELKATTLAGYCYNGMFQGCTKLSTVTMLAPSNQISEKAYCCNGWLNNAGTDETVSSRTLKVQDKAAYDALKNNLPNKWQIGKCTVLDNAGNAITE